MTNTFDAAADAYRRGRPTYAEDAVDAVVAHLGLRTGAHVVDLGAGTGILSRQLAARGLHVTAVEPVEGMRAELAGAADITARSGTAETTGLPDGCADAVVAGTAWHWFDADATIREVRRLLTDDAGGLGLLWNDYDTSVDWVAEYARITLRRRPDTSPSASGGAWRAFFVDLHDWEPLREERFANRWPTTPSGLVDRLRSSSAIAGLRPPEQDQAGQEVLTLLQANGLADRAELVLPYVTTIHWTRPRPRPPAPDRRGR